MDVSKIQPQQKNSKRKYIVMSCIFFVVVLSMFAYLFTSKEEQPETTSSKQIPLKTLVSNKSPSTVIATIGEEKIYQRDYNAELINHPQQNDIKVKKVIMEKMTEDSLILQGASKEGLITLDQSIFNSPLKNYQKRIQTIESAKKLINGRLNGYSGSVIAIWFFNNNEVGSHGYEKGKEIALTKITQLHRDVVNGTLSMEQAGEKIKNDKGLYELDRAYDVNAYFSFNVRDNKQITFDKGFDAKLRELEPGQISDIVLIKDYINGTMEQRDAVYMFGKMDNVIKNSLGTFEEWIDKQKHTYEITYH